MRNHITIAAMLMLAGCSSAGDKAANEYALAKDSPAGTSKDMCEAATRAKDAYLADGDRTNFERWSATAAMDCLRANAAKGR